MCIIVIQLHITTAARPNITKHPESVVIRAGDMNKMVMWCMAVGVSHLYYRWEKYRSSDNTWIRPSNRAVNITSPKLVYRLIKQEDEGIYRCVVFTNHNSVVASENATVRVYGRFVVYTVLEVTRYKSYMLHNIITFSRNK